MKRSIAKALPKSSTRAHDAPVYRATSTWKPLPPAEARAQWDRLVAALRRALAR